jgi:hypothetical protein
MMPNQTSPRSAADRPRVARSARPVTALAASAAVAAVATPTTTAPAAARSPRHGPVDEAGALLHRVADRMLAIVQDARGMLTGRRGAGGSARR